MIIINKELLKKDMAYKKERRRSIKYIRSLFDIYENEENTIDDETWDDLMMDEVYKELDTTYSSLVKQSYISILFNRSDILRN